MDPLMLEMPESIETERLILRLPRAGDGAMVHTSVRASIEQLKPWLPWATDSYSIDDGELWCRRMFISFHSRKDATYLILDRTSGSHLGNVSANNLDHQVRRCEIGYWMRTDQAGRGYMTEAVNALTAMLVKSLQMHRIQIRCDPRNLASAAVARKCGYEFEGTVRGDGIDSAGAFRDSLVFSRLFDST